MKKTILLTMVILTGCNNEEPETSNVISDAPPVTNNSGYTVNIDPATGEFLPAPPKTEPKKTEPPQANSTVQGAKSQPAEIIPSDVPGGGEMIRLNKSLLPKTQSSPATDQ